MKTTFPSLALAATFLALPVQAQPNMHGRVGEVMLGGSTCVYMGGVHNSRDNEGNVPALVRDAFSAKLVPSAAVFVAPHFAFGITHVHKNNDWSLVVGPQFIGHVSMAPTATLLPKLAVDDKRARGEKPGGPGLQRLPLHSMNSRPSWLTGSLASKFGHALGNTSPNELMMHLMRSRKFAACRPA